MKKKNAKKTVSRREFIAAVGGAAAAATPLAQAALLVSPPTNLRIYTPTVASSKPLLTAANFSHLGGFEVKFDWVTGFAFWRVNGQPRLLIGQDSNFNPVMEVTIPTTLTNSRPFQTATQVREWSPAQLYGNPTKRRGIDPTYPYDPLHHAGELKALYWDEVDSRLYWCYGPNYSNQPREFTLGYTKINPVTGTAEPYGPWEFYPRSWKHACSGITALPAEFVSKFLPAGERLAIGHGGYFSIEASPPVSRGPTLSAFNPARLTLSSEQTSIPSTTLTHHNFNDKPYTLPSYLQRDPNYTTEMSGDWAPKNGIGYATWFDRANSSLHWIDTGKSHGILYFRNGSEGHHWYGTNSKFGGAPSTGHCEWTKYVMSVFNPDDLGSVLLGKKDPTEVQPVSTYDYRNSPMLAGIYVESSASNVFKTKETFPLVGAVSGGDHAQMIIGSVYDPVDRRLYVLVRFGLHEYTNQNTALVHVFQITG